MEVMNLEKQLRIFNQHNTHLLTSANVRKNILAQSRRANVGHIGSALSIVELLVSLYKNILHIPAINAPDRDRFILSKGHASLALYCVFYLMDWLSLETLNTYCGDYSLLGMHPDHALPGIDFSTGSLGLGLSFGAGVALAARMQASKRKCYVLLSDAECNEGSIWEAVMFAAQHQLSNLVVIVDDNKQQAFGYTKDILSLNPLSRRFEAFGWNAIEVDGHDVTALTNALSSLDNERGAPHVILAQTIFGKGVSFMEKKIAWHYLPVNLEQYNQALLEIGVAT
jgi:transketolase